MVLLVGELIYNFFILCTCFLSPVSCLTSPVSCILSHVSCLTSSVICLLPHVSCLTSSVSCHTSHISCLTSHVSRLLSHVSCLASPVSRLLSLTCATFLSSRQWRIGAVALKVVQVLSTEVNSNCETKSIYDASSNYSHPKVSLKAEVNSN